MLTTHIYIGDCLALLSQQVVVISSEAKAFQDPYLKFLLLICMKRLSYMKFLLLICDKQVYTEFIIWYKR